MPFIFVAVQLFVTRYIIIQITVSTNIIEEAEQALKPSQTT